MLQANVHMHTQDIHKETAVAKMIILYFCIGYALSATFWSKHMIGNSSNRISSENTKVTAGIQWHAKAEEDTTHTLA